MLTAKIAAVHHNKVPPIGALVICHVDDLAAELNGATAPAAAPSELVISFGSTEIARRPGPTIDYTAAGPQYVIPGADGRRKIPDAKLRPKMLQNPAPLALELPAIEAKQNKLF